MAEQLFSSVSHYVSRHAPCPVIIVRETIPPPSWHHAEAAAVVAPPMTLSPLWSTPPQPSSQKLETPAVPATSPPFSTSASQASVARAIASSSPSHSANASTSHTVVSAFPPLATDFSQAATAPRLSRARSLSTPHVDQTAPLLVRSTTAPHYSHTMSNTTILSGPKHPTFALSKVDKHDPVSIRTAIVQLSTKKNPTSEDEANLAKLQEVLATAVQPAESGAASSFA